ncbi:tRNA-dihydrouridine synthase 3 [Diaporthe helianthi]|uniref:tRNA-dihydrouridine(47) synthase [NAD(P)(+)] n=1 Tax=Diaporthe helianthi TaxID=158607 RepID=A0A2P5I503_DIAHE|nr:tRNA-dihydrouridine synthase 3 [Diaporthe helianthi]
MEANGEVTEPQLGLDGNSADTERKRLLERPDEEPATKRAKASDDSAVATDEDGQAEAAVKPLPKGTAPVKQEYLIKVPTRVLDAEGEVTPNAGVDDDAAEDRGLDARDQGGRAKNKKQRGVNTEREFGFSKDVQELCQTRAHNDEFSPKECKHGARCNRLHDIRKYLAHGRRADLQVLGGKCPVWDKTGECPMGWKCLFVRSHMAEITHDDGRKELCLVKDSSRFPPEAPADGDGFADGFAGIVNNVPAAKKIELSRKKKDFSISDQCIQWQEEDIKLARRVFNSKNEDGTPKTQSEKTHEYRAAFIDPPFKPSEKRRIYFGRETPVLAPLTTQGNLPFRRLCVELGAAATYSEMAVGMHILQGQRSEWALLKAHESETTPPRLGNASAAPAGYDNSRDLKFGAQIAANAPWIAIKATQALSEYLPHLRLVDLNCGCPIDKVYKEGAGSALLDMPSKLERMVRGMNAVSGEVPITTKLRLGVKSDKPTAKKTIERLGLGGTDTSDVLGAPGCAAITLHGRSRQQRYRSAADWSYIAECGAMIQSYRDKKDQVTDTVREPDPSTLTNGGRMYFLGNGDCYSHVDYFNDVENARVDSVMIARGALIKPWIFEEIEKGQYLDKSSTERLGHVEKFARYGLEAWGSDEIGVSTTRKFLLEYLSFTHRYIPVGILEHLPPKINDRPPAYRGRDDMETLLASDNYKDWVKISEMFLGPVPQGFKFEPKHKSNAYAEAEG